MLEVISGKKCELEFVKWVLEDPERPPEVRLYFEEVVREAPDLLAASRSKESSEKGRQELTRAMRELL